MTQRMQSLQVLLQREQQHCDQAQSALRRADDMARSAREQREQLIAYRSEYQSRWTAQFNQGGGESSKTQGSNDTRKQLEALLQALEKGSQEDAQSSKYASVSLLA